ncbi:MAG: hypothetical protein EA409_01800 [Saprospirales bacterium]|nr:MAG: hypothetical protein EA409_01800 [Saprospirales bacterium]
MFSLEINEFPEVLVINNFEKGEFDGQFSFPPLEFKIKAHSEIASEVDAGVYILPLDKWNNDSIVVVYGGYEEMGELTVGFFVGLQGGSVVPLDFATLISEIDEPVPIEIYPVPADNYILVSIPSQESITEILIDG